MIEFCVWCGTKLGFLDDLLSPFQLCYACAHYAERAGNQHTEGALKQEDSRGSREL